MNKDNTNDSLGSYNISTTCRSVLLPLMSILQPTEVTDTLSPTAIGIAIRAFAPWIPW